jgi:GNAT superfamily N-acetyltransferase
MIKVVPYKKELLAGWYYNGAECPMFDGPGEVLARIDEFATKGRAFIGYLEDGSIVGVAGIFLENAWGGAYSWSFINQEGQKLGAIKAILEFEKELVAEMGIKRLQTLCSEACQATSLWMKALQYEREGLLKKAGPNGENLVLYAKVTG